MTGAERLIALDKGLRPDFWERLEGASRIIDPVAFVKPLDDDPDGDELFGLRRKYMQSVAMSKSQEILHYLATDEAPLIYRWERTIKVAYIIDQAGFMENHRIHPKEAEDHFNLRQGYLRTVAIRKAHEALEYLGVNEDIDWLEILHRLVEENASGDWLAARPDPGEARIVILNQVALWESLDAICSPALDTLSDCSQTDPPD